MPLYATHKDGDEPAIVRKVSAKTWTLEDGDGKPVKVPAAKVESTATELALDPRTEQPFPDPSAPLDGLHHLAAPVIAAALEAQREAGKVGAEFYLDSGAAKAARAEPGDELRTAHEMAALFDRLCEGLTGKR